MADHSGSWIYEGPAADRLWQKSAIGRPVGEGKLELSPAETLFVHYHRHLDLPTNDWKYRTKSKLDAITRIFHLRGSSCTG